MQHSIHTEGFGVRLRPVELADAAFIVWLRNLDFVKGRIGDSATDLAGQETWLEAWFEREGDYYFIAESLGGIPLGTIGIYDMLGTSAEQGRFIMRPEALAAVPSALLSQDMAFGVFGLTELRASSVSTNVAVHSLTRKCGFKQVGTLRAAQTIGGQPVDLVRFLLKGEDWPAVRARLVPLARVAEAQVLEWEKTQQRANQPWVAVERPGPVSARTEGNRSPLYTFVL
jgi:RimJ/RimL family protein N-acetyltransferase